MSTFFFLLLSKTGKGLFLLRKCYSEGQLALITIKTFNYNVENTMDNMQNILRFLLCREQLVPNFSYH